MQLSFRVPPVDVDVAFGALQERGLKVIEEPTNQAWGHRTPNFQLRASLAFRDVDALDNAHTNEQAAPHTPGAICADDSCATYGMMMISAPMGIQPAARKARSDAAFPGETSAKHH